MTFTGRGPDQSGGSPTIPLMIFHSNLRRRRRTAMLARRETRGVTQAQQEAPKSGVLPPCATPYEFPNAADIPPRSWLYGGHYIRGVATAAIAPGGHGKTTISLFEAITMAFKGLRVWFLSGEDPKVEIDRRIAAHWQHHQLDPSKITGKLFVDDR